MGWERPERARPLFGASVERGQSRVSVLAAEAGSGGRGPARTRGGGPRALELRLTAFLGWRKWRTLRRRRQDGGHGGAGEGALYPLCSRELPVSGGEGIGPGSGGGVGGGGRLGGTEGAEGDESGGGGWSTFPDAFSRS